jgi:hypothetical protein
MMKNCLENMIPFCQYLVREQDDCSEQSKGILPHRDATRFGQREYGSAVAERLPGSDYPAFGQILFEGRDRTGEPVCCVPFILSAYHSLRVSLARSSVVDNTTVGCQVYSPFFKTDPSAAWYDYGSKTFTGNRSESFPKAKAWASETYGITDWLPNAMRCHVPSIVQKTFPIRRQPVPNDNNNPTATRQPK